MTSKAKKQTEVTKLRREVEELRKEVERTDALVKDLSSNLMRINEEVNTYSHYKKYFENRIKELWEEIEGKQPPDIFEDFWGHRYLRDTTRTLEEAMQEAKDGKGRPLSWDLSEDDEWLAIDLTSPIVPSTVKEEYRKRCKCPWCKGGVGAERIHDD